MQKHETGPLNKNDLKLKKKKKNPLKRPSGKEVGTQQQRASVTKAVDIGFEFWRGKNVKWRVIFLDVMNTLTGRHLELSQSRC